MVYSASLRRKIGNVVFRNLKCLARTARLFYCSSRLSDSGMKFRITVRAVANRNLIESIGSPNGSNDEWTVDNLDPAPMAL